MPAGALQVLHPCSRGSSRRSQLGKAAPPLLQSQAACMRTKMSHGCLLLKTAGRMLDDVSAVVLEGIRLSTCSCQFHCPPEACWKVLLARAPLRKCVRGKQANGS